MAIVRIENVGSVGIIKDLPAHELPPEAWSDGQNVRFTDTKAQKISGETSIYSAPTVAPHWLLPWDTASGFRWIYAGTGQVHYVVSSGTSTNITRYTTTPGDNDYTAGARPVWSGGILHGLPILNNNNGVDNPQSWNTATNRLQNLPNWPANTKCEVLRIYRNFLVALNITTASGNFPHTIKWSHPADPGTVPVTWDESDATKLAGERALSESTGFLVDCLPLLGQNILYKTDSIHTMRLSNSQFVFAFDEISSSIGALTINCIREFFGQHFVVGTNDIVLFDGRKPTSIVNQRVRKLFYDSLDPDFWNKTYVMVHYPRREIWVCYVQTGAAVDYPNTALIWNWDTNSWTIKDLPDIAYSATGEVVEVNSATFDSSSGTFSTDTGPFDDSEGSPANRQILHARAKTTASFYKGNDSYQSAGTSYTSRLERTGLAIAGVDRQGRPKVDPSSVKFLRSVFPKITAPSNATVQISVGMQETLGGAITWEGPYDFEVNVDTRVDTCLQGRYMALKVEDTGNQLWEMTGYALDIEVIARN